MRKKIAVIGAGISGLSAAWLLSRRHSVTLFEAQPQLGGHAHTVQVELDGRSAPVDTGFLVYNERTYPNLIALFAALGVQTAPSDMSFSVRVADERVEWAGSDLSTVFAHARNLVRPRFWSMLRDILRFNRDGTALVTAGRDRGETLGEFLDRGAYGRSFRDWYLLPMAAAIWSCPTREMLDYPCATFLRFCHNHGLLQVNDRPQWHTVRGGSQDYVRRMAAAILDVRPGTPVRRIKRSADSVEVVAEGMAERFDEVVLACHTDQSLRLLADADEDERALLGAIRYQPNVAVLHCDARFLPEARRAWSAWNYETGAGVPGARPVSVSYWLNRLQPLPFSSPLVETLNPIRPPREELVIGTFRFSHPIFDAAALRAQAQLPRVQGRRRTWFCGAWAGYGFHEDGLRSGMAVANALGVRAPWQSKSEVAAEAAAALA